MNQKRKNFHTNRGKVSVDHLQRFLIPAKDIGRLFASSYELQQRAQMYEAIAELTTLKKIPEIEQLLFASRMLAIACDVLAGCIETLDRESIVASEFFNTAKPWEHYNDFISQSVTGEALRLQIAEWKKQQSEALNGLQS